MGNTASEEDYEKTINGLLKFPDFYIINYLPAFSTADGKPTFCKRLQGP